MPTRIALACALAFVAGPAVAQPPEPLVAPPPVAPEPTATDILVEARPVRRIESRVDLTVGLPIAVRYQARILGPVWAEVGAGLWVIIPGAFAGFRLDAGLDVSSCDTLSVRPGVAVHGLFNPFYGGSGWLSGGPPVVPAVGGDVDLVWRHRWKSGVCGELGLKLGVVTGFGENVVPIPTGGVIVGLQF